MGTCTATFLLISAGSTSMWMKDGLGSEVLQPPGDPVVEPGAHRYEQVGLADRVVGVLRAVHAQHAHGQMMVFGEAALTGERGGHWDIAVHGHLAELLGGVRDDDPASGIYDGALGGGDHARRLDDLFGVPLQVGLVAGQAHLGHRGGVVVHIRFGDVHRDVYEHRAGTARARYVEGLADDAGQRLLVLDQVAVLDDRQGDTGDVGLLEGIETDEVPADLARDGHHGHAVHIGVGYGRHQVGGPGSGGGQTHPHLARSAGVAVGGMPGALLVAHQDMVDVGLVDGVVQGDHLSPWVAEYRVDPLAPQRFEDDFRAFHVFPFAVIRGQWACRPIPPQSQPRTRRLRSGAARPTTHVSVFATPISSATSRRL